MEEKIKNILKKITKNDKPDMWDEEYQFYPGELDSLDMATLAMNLEEEFSIIISDEMLSNINTLTNIKDYIKTFLETK